MDNIQRKYNEQSGTYNGWTNQDTYNLALWMNNDEDAYRFFLPVARYAPHEFATHARSYALSLGWNEVNPDQVNYEEIREGLLEGQE